MGPLAGVAFACLVCGLVCIVAVAARPAGWLLATLPEEPGWSVVTIPSDQPPRDLVLGSSGDRFLLAMDFADTNGVYLQPLPGNGAQPTRLTELDKVSQLLETPNGALLLNDHQILTLDRAGQPAGSPRNLEDTLGSAGRVFTIAGDTLAALTLDRPHGRVTFRAYSLTGDARTPEIEIARDPYPGTVAGIARIGDAAFLLAWQTDKDRLATAVVGRDGRVLRPEAEQTRPTPLFDLNCCRALPAANGGASIAWTEAYAISDLFDFQSFHPKVHIQRFGADGTPGAVTVAGQGAFADHGLQSAFSGSEGALAWASGLRDAPYGFGGGSYGIGRAVTYFPQGNASAASHNLPFSVEEVFIALHGPQIGVVATGGSPARTAIYARVFSR